jgi:CBS-domain-containing membrane protein
MVDMIIIASIGASTFVLFAMPKYPQARDRNLIGGQLIGLTCGSLFSLVPHSSFYSDVMVDALAVGLTFLIMVLTDTEHPPAAGTALGMVVVGFSFEIAISVISSVMLLSLIHRCLRRFLIDLV